MGFQGAYVPTSWTIGFCVMREIADFPGDFPAWKRDFKLLVCREFFLFSKGMCENCYFKLRNRDVNPIFLLSRSWFLYMEPYGNHYISIKRDAYVLFGYISFFVGPLQSDGNIFPVFQFFVIFFFLHLHMLTQYNFRILVFIKKWFTASHRSLKSPRVCIKITKVTEIWLSI